MPAKLLTRLELAEALGVNPRTIHKWIDQRAIPFIRINKTVRFDLDAVLAAKTVNPPKSITAI